MLMGVLVLRAKRNILTLLLPGNPPPHGARGCPAGSASAAKGPRAAVKGVGLPTCCNPLCPVAKAEELFMLVRQAPVWSLSLSRAPALLASPVMSQWLKSPLASVPQPMGQALSCSSRDLPGNPRRGSV